MEKPGPCTFTKKPYISHEQTDSWSLGKKKNPSLSLLYWNSIKWLEFKKNMEFVWKPPDFRQILVGLRRPTGSNLLGRLLSGVFDLCLSFQQQQTSSWTQSWQVKGFVEPGVRISHYSSSFSKIPGLHNFNQDWNSAWTNTSGTSFPKQQ